MAILYLLRTEIDGEEVHKIGITIEFERRLQEYRRRHKSFDIVSTHDFSTRSWALYAEDCLCRQFSRKRHFGYGREYFYMTPKDIIAYAKRADGLSNLSYKKDSPW